MGRGGKGGGVGRGGGGGLMTNNEHHYCPYQADSNQQHTRGGRVATRLSHVLKLCGILTGFSWLDSTL